MNKNMDFNSDENKDFSGRKEEGKKYLTNNDELDINKEEDLMNINLEKKLDTKNKLENKEQQTKNNFAEKIDIKINDKYSTDKSLENNNVEGKEFQIQLENKQKIFKSNNNDIYNINNKLNNIKLNNYMSNNNDNENNNVFYNENEIKSNVLNNNQNNNNITNNSQDLNIQSNNMSRNYNYNNAINQYNNNNYLRNQNNINNNFNNMNRNINYIDDLIIPNNNNMNIDINSNIRNNNVDRNNYMNISGNQNYLNNMNNNNKNMDFKGYPNNQIDIMNLKARELYIPNNNMNVNNTNFLENEINQYNNINGNNNINYLINQNKQNNNKRNLNIPNNFMNNNINNFKEYQNIPNNNQPIKYIFDYNNKIHSQNNVKSYNNMNNIKIENNNMNMNNNSNYIAGQNNENNNIDSIYNNSNLNILNNNNFNNTQNNKILSNNSNYSQNLNNFNESLNNNQLNNLITLFIMKCLISKNNALNDAIFEGQNVNDLINNNLYNNNIPNYSIMNNFNSNNIQLNNDYNSVNQNQILSNNNQIKEFNQNNFSNNIRYNENNYSFDNNNNEYNINNNRNNTIQIQNENNNIEDNSNKLNSLIQIFIKSINELLNDKINAQLKIKLDKNGKFEKIDNISLYYITNKDKNKENEKNQLMLDLIQLKVGNFEDIKFPTISDKDIEERINIINYKKTEEDNKLIEIIKNYDFSSFSRDKFDFGKNIFYSHNKMSLYSPHVLKEKKDITSIFLNEDQKKYSIYDFQYIYSHLNKHIFKDLLEKRIIQLNNKEMDEKKYGFYNNYMYTIMDKKIVEKKLNDTNIFKLKQELLANKSEKYYFSNFNKDRKDDDKLFIFSDNIEYLKGLSYEEVMLYIILDRLENFIQLPNIIFYECLMNIMGQTIIISDKNLQPGYQKIDYVLYCNQNFYFDQKESPFYVQSEYYYNGNEFMKNNDGYVFKMYQNRLYFFEFKSSLDYFESKNNNLNNIDNYKKKNPGTFLIKLIKKCMLFKQLYVNKLSLPNDTKIEIIIFYDNKISKIFDSYIDTIKSILINTNITLSLIYILSSYPSYSLRSEIEKNKEFRKKYDKMENENNQLKQDVSIIKKENNQLKRELNELKEKFDKLEKEK